MKINFSAPIRSRTDGSLYVRRPTNLFGRLCTIAVFFILPAFFAVVVLLAIVGPFGVEAERFDGDEEMNGVGGPEFAGEGPFDDFAWPVVSNTENAPSVFPVDGKPTSNFGFRRNPFGGVSSEFHAGQDFAAPAGTAVSATANGEVVFSGWQRGLRKYSDRPA